MKCKQEVLHNNPKLPKVRDINKQLPLVTGNASNFKMTSKVSTGMVINAIKTMLPQMYSMISGISHSTTLILLIEKIFGFTVVA